MIKDDPSILLLTNEYLLVDGGVATYCYEMTKNFHNLGYPIVVIAPNKKPRDLEFDEKQPFPIHRVKEHKLGLARHLARALTLWKNFYRYKPTLLWAADWRAGIPVMLLSKWTKTPYVITAHGTEVLLAQSNWLKKKVALSVYNQANKIFCVSHFTQNLVIQLGVSSKKVRRTPLGVNYRKTSNDQGLNEQLIQLHKLHGKKIILTLARLTARKGQDTMIQVMPKVLEKIPEAIYLIVGRGEDEQRLKSLVDRLGLSEHVIFAGYVEDQKKDAYYQISDLYVMLSRQEGLFVEGFGLTLLEAGMHGKSVIAGRHGGVPDAVIDGETGTLVDPYNIDEIANAVIYLLENPQLAARMGENAQNWISKSANWEETAHTTLRAIQE